MRLTLSEARMHRIQRSFEIAIIVAALATMPLTYAHMQEMDGAWLFAADWLVWGVFFAEFSFAMAVSASRKRTMRRQWFNLAIVVVSFPLLPHLLGLTRLVRLIQPLRVIGGFRLARPLQLARLYALRSAGSKVAFRRAKEEGIVDAVQDRAGQHVPGVPPGSKGPPQTDREHGEDAGSR